MNIFNRTLCRRNIRNKEAFLLHHILGYFKDFCGDYGNEPIFTSIVSLKRELLKMFENGFNFFPSAKFVIKHSSTANPFKYSVAALKFVRHQRSFANFVCREAETMTSKALPKTTEDMLDKARYLDKATTLK